MIKNSKLKIKNSRLLRSVVGILVILGLLAGVAAYLSHPAAAGWYGDTWGYRKKLTIDHTKVSGGADLSSFPVLVSLTDGSLSKAQSNGNDILFTGSDGTTKLDHEIEKFTQSTGTLVAWVRIPTLSYQNDTVIYMYYGNSSSPSQQNKTGVWDSNYLAVYHMSETSGHHLDSKNSNNSTSETNLVAQGTATGMAGGADQFNGLSETIAVDTVTNSGGQTVTNASWSHTVSGTNRVLVIGVNVNLMNTETCNGVTYNGVALTKIRTDRTTGDTESSLWYLLAPDIGTHSVSVTVTGVVSGTYWVAGAISLTGVKQAAPEANNGSNSATDPISTSLTTVSDNSWIVTTGNEYNAAGTISADASQTEQWNVKYNNLNTGGGTYGPVTPAGSKTVNWHKNSGTDIWGAISAASFAPATGTASVVNLPVIALGGNDGTIEAWVKSDVTSANHNALGRYYTQQSLLLNSSAYWMSLINPGGSNAYWNGLIDTNWHYLTGVYDGSLGSANLNLYVDGTQRSSSNGTGNIVNEDKIWQIGSNGNSQNYWSGLVDEVRLSTTPRPAGWIATTYNTINNNTAFFSAKGNEEQNKQPVLNFKFNEGYGTTTTDSSPAKITGTFSGTVKPAWATEDMCVSGKCLYFEGSAAYLTAPTIPNVQSISFWEKTASASGNIPLVKLTSSANIYLIGGNTVTATGFTSPKVYVNGQPGITVSPNVWNHIEITDTGPITANNIMLGTVNASVFFSGWLDEFKLYDYPRTAAQVKLDYNAKSGATSRGSGVSFGAQTTDALSKGLVGYWKMDEATWSGTLNEVVDSSGNGNNGTAGGATGGKAYPSSGKFGNGGYFDGVDDYLDMGNPANLSFGTNNFSVSVWIKTAYSGSGFVDILGKYDGSNGLYLQYVGSTHTWYFGWANPGEGLFTITDNLSDGNWHNIVFQREGAALVSVYIDGALNSSKTGYYSGSSDSSLNLYIGNLSSVYSRYWPGLIDEVRIYNRALSPAEVSQLYNWAPGPLINVNFDNSSGSTYYDLSGSGHNALVQDLATNQACNDWLLQTFSMDTWIKIHDSIQPGSETVRNYAKSVTYTKGVDYDMDYTNGRIKLLTGGSMTTGTYYYTNTTCTNTGPRLVIGKFGKALQFDGADDSLMINNASDLALNNNSRTTQMAWVFINADVDELGVYSGQGIFGQDYFIRLLYSSDSEFYLAIMKNDLSFESVYTATNYPKGHWYHVATTWDGTYGKVYVNGVLAATSPNWSSYAVKSAQADWYVGRSQSGVGKGILNGILDDVKYYNYVRTPAQIIQDMNAGHPAPGSPVGSALINYKFNEASGTTLNNLGNLGSSANATVSGTLWDLNGKFAGAQRFTGSASYDSSPKLALLAGDSVTYNTLSWGGWFNPSSSAASKTLIIKNNEFRLTTDSSSRPNCQIYSSSWQTAAVGITALPLNSWSHVLCTYDGSNIHVYVNGTEAGGAVSQTGSLTSSNTTGLNLGWNYAGGQYFQGLMDDVKIYNSALTADQVKEESNRGFSQSMGSLSDTSSLTGGSNASNSASAAFCVPGSSDPCAPPVGYWKLDEYSDSSGPVTRYDSSGNGNDLTDGYTTNAPSTIGKIGTAASFTRSKSQALYIDNASQKGLGITGPITVCGWFRSTSQSTTNRIAEKFKFTGNQLSYSLYLWGNNVYFEVSSNGSAAYSANGATTISNNTWYYTCGVYTGSQLQVYLNGTLDTNGSNNPYTYSSGIYNSTADFTISDIHNGDYFDGAIDNVIVYNYARTPAQVAWDYNRGAPIAQYNFNECTGTVLHDTAPKSDIRNFTALNGTIVPDTGRTAGTCGSGVSTEMWNGGTTGKYSGSLAFDGSGDYVSIPSDSRFQIAGDMTVSAWINPNSVSGTHDIISLKTGGGVTRYVLTEINHTIQMTFALTGGNIWPNLANAVNTGSWYHLVGVLNGTNGILYINGVPAATMSGSGTMQTTAQPLYIGSTMGSSNFFNGQIDDVRIYNYALTPVQVKTLYNQGSAVSF